MSPVRIRAPYLTLALSAITIAGCEGDLTTGEDGPGGEITRDIGTTVRDEVETLVSALTLQTSLGPVGTTQAASAPTAPMSAPCVSPSTPADSDGDGVPDDALYLLTSPPCRFTGWRGGTLEIWGQLRIQDPDPAQAGFGYEGTLTNLLTRLIASDNKVIYDVRRNGSRVLSGSVSSLLLSEEVQIIRTFAGRLDAAIDQQWSVTYTPAASLQINQPIPSGTMDIAGTVNWDREPEHYNMTVITPTPLHYNAGCTDTVQRIDGGELHLAGTFDDIDGSVRVRWNECGREPAIDFVAAE
jgi:hypothetical protein